jgi:OOP family OmpA-OmpF porin
LASVEREFTQRVGDESQSLRDEIRRRNRNARTTIERMFSELSNVKTDRNLLAGLFVEIARCLNKTRRQRSTAARRPDVRRDALTGPAVVTHVVARLPLPAAQSAELADNPPPETGRMKRLADLLLEVARSVDPNVAATLPSKLDGDPRLEAVRSVLLERERTALAQLQQTIDDPQRFAKPGRALADALRRPPPVTKIASARRLWRATQASFARTRARSSAFSTRWWDLRSQGVAKHRGTLQRLVARSSQLFAAGLEWRLEALRSGTSFADVVLKHTISIAWSVFRSSQIGLLLEHVAAKPSPLGSAARQECSRRFRTSCATRSTASARRGIDTLRLATSSGARGPAARISPPSFAKPPESLPRCERHRCRFTPRWVTRWKPSTATLALGELRRHCETVEQQDKQRRKSASAVAVALGRADCARGSLAVDDSAGDRAAAFRRLCGPAARRPGVVVTRRAARWRMARVGLARSLAVNPRTSSQPRTAAGERRRSLGAYQALNP